MLSGVLAGVSAGVVAIVCTFLVLHKDYEDGLFGRIGLSMMVIASISRAAQLVAEGFDRAVNPIGVVLWVGLAIFMTRHAYRFWRFRTKGEYAWRGADRATACGKQ